MKDKVRKSNIDKFTKLGGYDIVRRKGDSWRGVSKASRKTGLSRPTIYAILEKYPEPPEKDVTPKYVAKFKETEAYAKITELYKREKFLKDVLYALKEGWKFLGQKEPMKWQEADYRKIWNSEKFLDRKTNFIAFHHSVNFRRIMRATEKHALQEKFKTKTRPTGEKKLWYLSEDEIVALAGELPTCDMVIQTLRGITEGARHQALCTTTPERIKASEHVLMVFESKIQEWVEKLHTDKVMGLIMRYIKDFNIQPKKPLHPFSYDHYLRILKTAGEEAGLTKTISTHIFKHTFISQAHAHGVSGETVVDQVHTELRTVIAFYRAGDERKRRKELRGEKYDVEPFNEWIENKIYPAFEKRYEELRSIDHKAEETFKEKVRKA